MAVIFRGKTHLASPFRPFSIEVGSQGSVKDESMEVTVQKKAVWTDVRRWKRWYERYLAIPTKRLLFYSGIGKRLFLDAEGRVRIRKLEIYIANGCNLKCRFCSHLNPYRKGLIPADTLITSFECWSRKIAPRTIGLLGGEPLLHPELFRIIRSVHACWPNSEIVLTTNGLLLHRHPDAMIEALREANIHVILSLHTRNPEKNRLFEEAIARLRQGGVRTKVLPSADRWKRYHWLDDAGRPQPYRSDPEKAWTRCGPNTSFNLTDNHLYRCSLLANTVQAYREGVLGPAWRVVETYEPLAKDATASQIVEHLHLRSQPLVACTNCPEWYEVVDAVQLDEIPATH